MRPTAVVATSLLAALVASACGSGSGGDTSTGLAKPDKAARACVDVFNQQFTGSSGVTGGDPGEDTSGDAQKIRGLWLSMNNQGAEPAVGLDASGNSCTFHISSTAGSQVTFDADYDGTSWSATDPQPTNRALNPDAVTVAVAKYDLTINEDNTVSFE